MWGPGYLECFNNDLEHKKPRFLSWVPPELYLVFIISETLLAHNSQFETNSVILLISAANTEKMAVAETSSGRVLTSQCHFLCY